MTRNVFLAASLAAPVMADGFELTSPDIAEGQQLSAEFVFTGFGCEGGLFNRIMAFDSHRLIRFLRTLTTQSDFVANKFWS